MVVFVFQEECAIIALRATTAPVNRQNSVDVP